MKKTLIFLFLMFAVCLSGMTYFGGSYPAGWQDLGKDSSDNHVYIAYDKTNDVVECTKRVGYASKRDTWDNLVAASSVSISLGINITTATVDNSVGYKIVPADLTSQPSEARNIIFDWSTATASSATVTFCGLDARGNGISETQIIGNVVNASITNNKAFTVIYGATITFNSGVAQDAVPHLVIGTGDKIGLLGDIVESSNVRALKVQTGSVWANETKDATINATYDTWYLADVPDAADDYRIIYISASE